MKIGSDAGDAASPTEANADHRPARFAASGYFEATRSEDALELIRLNPLAFTLAYIIAARANWRGGFNHQNLEFGEAFLGDHEKYGMSEREYRTAKGQLASRHFAAFKSTNKGTIAKLTDTRLFKINQPKCDGPKTDTRRPADRQPTTNLNLKAVKQESYKAFSTKTNKLSASQKEQADRIEGALGDQWVGHPHRTLLQIDRG